MDYVLKYEQPVSDGQLLSWEKALHTFHADSHDRAKTIAESFVQEYPIVVDGQNVYKRPISLISPVYTWRI